MMDELQPLVQRYGLSVSRVDIDGSAELEDRFGQKVPVLAAGGQEICHFRLDVRALERFLRGRST
ncbi:MAG: glutaredoxin family protein [Gammaproteobacteria bacterium]|nr:glutaredoxin family protein [Gammaproteobacteria bacterium]NIR32875.1 glutaredoxin family protein [Gammaproteobacteria bacterium]NIR99421.1 glutaredoxin family protein [Gammaproteobacteria bacterium]NIT65035.1 glutaredoxin family protein [Gammaproteobacteria bacterium]NIV21950.1 glutaredoxin family protein [Gammaproteobacteria bacterium]